MTKFMAVLEYDGTNYHGWQLQKDVPTVQATVEEALGRILGSLTRVYGAGRTDAGVHAEGQVAHFLADWPHQPLELQRAMNALLPADITARRVALATEAFHARHSARSKTYAYRILNRPLRSSLFRFFSWHVPQPLNLEHMSQASNLLLGSHDFAAFGSPTDGTPSTVRESLHAGWSRDATREMLLFEISGTGFLRYMVRSLVGTLVLVGRGKIAPDDLLGILASRDRSRSGPTAPAHGLCLQSVAYADPDGTLWTSNERVRVCSVSGRSTSLV